MVWRMKELEKLLNSIDYDKLWDGSSNYVKWGRFQINDNEGLDIELIKKIHVL